MPINENETISRFAVDQAYFRTSDNKAKPKAFMPDRYGNTSVFRIFDLSEQEKWEMGEEYVARPQGKNIRASIEIEVGYVIKQKLDVIPDDTPPRHANICNWPEEKSAKKIKAMELAGKSKLFIKAT